MLIFRTTISVLSILLGMILAVTGPEPIGFWLLGLSFGVSSSDWLHLLTEDLGLIIKKHPPGSAIE